MPALNFKKQLAHADGFDSLADFRKFFEQSYSLPFDGIVIGWA